MDGRLVPKEMELLENTGVKRFSIERIGSWVAKYMVKVGR